MNSRVLTTLILIVLGAPNTSAQRPSPTPPPAPVLESTQKPDEVDVVKITSNLVQVDAVVTDKNGKIVTDLRADEVQISEDGKPQKITHFGYNVTGPETAGRAVKPVATGKVNEVAPPVVPVPLKREDVHRTIAIVVDDLGLSFESIAYMRRALKAFVDEQMQSGDLVAIIRTGGSVGALQQFSSDKRQLYAAIERVKWNPMGTGDTGAFSAIRPADLKIPGEQASRGLSPDAYRAEVAVDGMVGTLSYVVRGLRDLPGRKSVLLLSDGLIIKPIDSAGMGTSRVQTALESLIDLANRASVVIYTMDARGLIPLGLQAQDNVQMSAPVGHPGPAGPIGVVRSVREVDQLMTIRRKSFEASRDGLIYLAQQTGGLAITETNDFSGGIQRVLDDQRGYYLIGYRPDETTFDATSGQRKFHTLSLKVTRPGKFNVRMRNGFFGISEEEVKPPQKTTAQQLLNAITSPFETNDIHLQLTSLFVNDVTNGSYMLSMLHIDARELTFKEGPNGTHEAVFDVLAMTFGSNGVPGDYVARTFTVQLPEDYYQRALRQGFVYNVNVPIKRSGAYQFRISLRDAGSDRIGSAGQFIAVPDLDKNQLTLSGVVLSGTSIDSATGRPGMANAGASSQTNDPEASPAVRHFRQGMQLDFAYLIYNAQPDKSTQKPGLTTQVRLFRDGKQVFSGGERPFDAMNQTDVKRLVASGAVILGTDLTPGEYVLQVVVTDTLADRKYRTVTQWMDFDIIK